MPLQTFSGSTRVIDHAPSIRSAGIYSTNDTMTTKQCIVHTNDNTFERTNTPSSLQQLPLNSNLYRKTQPGIRYIHGIHNTDAIESIDINTVHGIQSNRSGDRASDTVLNSKQTSEINQYLQEQRERIYRSTNKPIGRSTIHNNISYINSDDIHGITSDSSESAKTLIYKDEKIDRFIDPLKGDVDITRRINRDYINTSIDIHTYRHGKLQQHNALNSSHGVTDALNHTRADTVIGSARDQQLRYMHSKPIGSAVHTVPIDNSYIAGSRVKFDSVGTYDCIRGNYTAEQQQPDSSIGRSVPIANKLRPSLIAPVDTNKTYGLPSIRTDLQTPPSRRSIASEVNYGDEHSAAQLIAPYQHSYSGVDKSDFTNECTRDYICTVYNHVGLEYTVDDNEFNIICDTAIQLYGKLSIDSFRHAYNELNVVENGNNENTSSLTNTQQFNNVAYKK